MFPIGLSIGIYYRNPDDGKALESTFSSLDDTSRSKKVSFGNGKAISVWGGISIVSATPLLFKSAWKNAPSLECLLCKTIYKIRKKYDYKTTIIYIYIYINGYIL